MRSLPIISIVIPTLNSEDTLPSTLNSIKKQKYPSKKVEILLVDGGSKDRTLEIAKEYRCFVIHNNKVDLVYAKHLGFLKAQGKYLIFLDSDESLSNKNSFTKRVSVFNKNEDVKAILPSGYKSPKDAHKINDYINEFGDPFSFFYYRESKGYKYLISDLKKSYETSTETKDYMVMRFTTNLPLIELWAGGCMVDLNYCRNRFKKIRTNPYLIAHLFYLLHSNNKSLAVTKCDATLHNSCRSIGQYKRKLISRIKNNVFQTDMGTSGFTGRTRVSNKVNIKKFLFPVYSFSLILPIIDSIYLTVTRKNSIYLLHPYLCIYTSFYILYFYFLKVCNMRVALKNYGS